MPSQRKVAVSYSWGEERSGANAGAVDTFCKALKGCGIEIIRDNERLKHGQSISEFMRQIGSSNFLCVFLSEGYLRSPNCMYELLVAWQRSKDHPTEFSERVKVWVMPGTEGIHKLTTRVEYLRHWIAEKAKVEPLIVEFSTSGLSPGSLNEFKRIKEIGENVDGMLKFFSDHLSPGSAAEFQKWIEDHFPDSTGAGSPASVAQIYENTVDEIETILNRLADVRQFLASVTTDLVQQEPSGWKLTASVKGGRFDVSPYLENIAKKLASFRPPSASNWTALGEVVGGLVVLAIDPQWVREQQKNARLESADFPSDSESIGIGSGQQANLLHLITCALADGRARLEKVFGKPPLDENRMPDCPELMQGIGEADRQREVKLHFIRFVLGPNTPIDKSNAKQINILFDRTKKVISSALHDNHTPYVATGENYKLLKPMIREHLRMEDLLLIHPSGDDPELLMTDYVRVLRFLGRIFDTVQANARL